MEHSEKLFLLFVCLSWSILTVLTFIFFKEDQNSFKFIVMGQYEKVVVNQRVRLYILFKLAVLIQHLEVIISHTIDKVDLGDETAILEHLIHVVVLNDAYFLFNFSFLVLVLFFFRCVLYWNILSLSFL